MKAVLSKIEKVLTARQFVYVGVTLIVTSIGAGILLCYFIVKNRNLRRKDENK